VCEKESGDKLPHSKVLDCGALRVVFDWRGDRYGHNIQQQFEDAWHTVLESLEGSPDEDWPPSPVLQSLHIERRDTASVALLVGKSGTSHWSASVEPVASRTALQFDIACRVQSPPEQIGSVYRLVDRTGLQIAPVTVLPQVGSCECVERQESDSWLIRPLIASGEYPCTIRWRYTISLDHRTP
jgi:hypothetical protein